MVFASSSRVRWASRQTWRSWPSFSSPMTVATALATGSASVLSRMPTSSRARIRAAADPASAALAGGAAAAAKSPTTIWQVQARSQARSPGRRATWRASIRDSSSARAAADQAALVPWGARQREWAACAHSCTVAPHKAG
jgi:hypothetical protein